MKQGSINLVCGLILYQWSVLGKKYNAFGKENCSKSSTNLLGRPMFNSLGALCL